MADIRAVYDGKNDELRLPTAHFRRYRQIRGGAYLVWVAGNARGVPIAGGHVLARVDWDDGSEDYLLVPAACEGVIKKTNRSLKHLTPHQRPAQWMVILEVS